MAAKDFIWRRAKIRQIAETHTDDYNNISKTNEFATIIIQ